MKFKFEVKYIPLFFLSAFLIKCLFLGFDWTTVGFVFVLGAISGFYETKNKDKQMELLHKRCDLIDQHLTEFKKSIMDVREVTDSWRLNTQIKTFNRK